MSGIEDSPVGAAPNLADRTNRDTGATDNGRHWKAGTQVHGGSDRQAYSDFARALSRACATSVQSPPDDFTSHNPVEDPIEDAGIKLGEVVGWRAWRMSGSSYLRSVMASDIWMPSLAVEAHKIGPAVGDGIHAFKEQEDALRFAESLTTYLRYLLIVGRVALWGQIYEFERGWHGEYAKVHSLDICLRLDQLRPKRYVRFPAPLAELRRHYGLDPDGRVPKVATSSRSAWCPRN